MFGADRRFMHRKAKRTDQAKVAGAAIAATGAAAGAALLLRRRRAG
jgi:hypothetical protein